MATHAVDDGKQAQLGVGDESVFIPGPDEPGIGRRAEPQLEAGGRHALYLSAVPPAAVSGESTVRPT
jgi:hypothetical protein